MPRAELIEACRAAGLNPTAEDKRPETDTGFIMWALQIPSTVYEIHVITKIPKRTVQGLCASLRGRGVLYEWGKNGRDVIYARTGLKGGNS